MVTLWKAHACVRRVILVAIAKVKLKNNAIIVILVTFELVILFRSTTKLSNLISKQVTGNFAFNTKF